MSIMDFALTYERLKTLIHYNQDTGVFIWIAKPSPKISIGAPSGTKNAHGYVYIHIDGKDYLAHRLAFFIVNGRWPYDEIDHIDCNPSNNRIANLRESTRSENAQNMRSAQANNKSSGLLGVTKISKSVRWRSQIQVNGKHTHLGSFDTPEEAHAAYVIAKRELHSFSTI
jgi:hypothetical protein